MSLFLNSEGCQLFSLLQVNAQVHWLQTQTALIKFLGSKNPEALYPCSQIKPTRKRSWQLLLSVCSIPASLAAGRQEASLPIVPPVLGQDLITAEYIPIWGYCRPVRVLIVNDAAALSDSFLSGLAQLAILKAVSSFSWRYLDTGFRILSRRRKDTLCWNPTPTPFQVYSEAVFSATGWMVLHVVLSRKAPKDVRAT